MAKRRRKSRKAVKCKFGKLKNPTARRICRKKLPGRRSRRK